jgi:predicted Fe-Mo cluster-binding NifX family protein
MRVFRVEQGRYTRIAEITLTEQSLSTRLQQLKNSTIDTVLCCGISPALYAALTSAGVRVLWGIAGEVDEVMTAFVQGTPFGPALRMPGYGGMRRRRRYRGGGPR